MRRRGESLWRRRRLRPCLRKDGAAEAGVALEQAEQGAEATVRDVPYAGDHRTVRRERKRLVVFELAPAQPCRRCPRGLAGAQAIPGWTVFEIPSTPGCLLAVRWILCGRDRRIARDDSSSSSSSRDLGVRWVAFGLRVRQGQSIRPLLCRPAVPRRGLLVLWPVYCVQERGRKVLVEIPLPRRSLLPLAIRLLSSSQPLLFLAVVDHGSSVGHVRMVPSAEFRFSFSHARPVDCRPCRQLVRAWLQQETTVLAGFKFGSRTIKLKRLVLHVRDRGRPFG